MKEDVRPLDPQQVRGRVAECVKRGRYRDPDRVIDDTTELLLSMVHLVPSTGDHGSECRLEINGVVPFQYGERQYHAPLLISVPLDYPQSAPICRVTPTEDMLVTPNNPNVRASDGRVTTDYLEEWDSASSLLLAMCAIAYAFTLIPPVFSRKSSVTSTPVSSSAATPSPTPQHDGETSSPRETCKRKARDRFDVLRQNLRVASQSKLDLETDEYKLVTSVSLLRDQTQQMRVAVAAAEEGLRAVNQWLGDSDVSVERHVDEIVQGADKRSQQLLELEGTDSALTDTMYYVTRALEMGNIDVSLWLKTMRQLASEQYKARATRVKIQSMAGLVRSPVNAAHPRPQSVPSTWR